MPEYPIPHPIRIPKGVTLCPSEPAYAEAGQKGSWTLKFVLSKDVSPDQRLWLYLYGGRNLKPAWSGVQIEDPLQDGYVLLARASGQLLGAVGQNDSGGIISFAVPEEGLSKGETITARLLKVTAPALSQPDRFFLLLTASPGEELKIRGLWGEVLERIVGACVLPILGGPIRSIRAIAPSTCTPGESISILVRPEDANYNTANTTLGKLAVEVNGEKKVPEQASVGNTVCVQVKSISVREGVNRLEVSDSLSKFSSVTNPIVCRNCEYRLLWGALHGHTEMSDGVGSLERYFRYMRDECALDFGACSDHDSAEETPDDLWHSIQEIVAHWNEPGRFTTFLGYEWAKWRKLGHGDRNIYYLHDFRPIYRSDEGHYPTPPELFEALKNETALIIPHHPAHPGNHNDWTYHEPQKERLVEIYSIWGCSERSIENGNRLPGRPQFNAESPPMNPLGYVQRALALGWRVGFTADYDDHLNHVGDRTVRTHGHTGGLTAVWAKGNTRELIWEALWNRRCYGTTGERIVVDFCLNGFPMGSELSVLEHPDLATRRQITATVYGTAPINSIEIVRNNMEVYAISAGTLDCRVECIDDTPLSDINLPPAIHSPVPFTFYYLRVSQENGTMAWASPIWIV